MSGALANRRMDCHLCGRNTAVRGGWPEQWLHPHTDPKTRIRCEASDYYLDEGEPRSRETNEGESDMAEANQHVKRMFQDSHRDLYMKWWDGMETLANERQAVTIHEGDLEHMRNALDAIAEAAKEHGITLPEDYYGDGTPKVKAEESA